MAGFVGETQSEVCVELLTVFIEYGFEDYTRIKHVMASLES